MTYLLIGSGRLARHLKFYFENSGLGVLTWSRSLADQEALAALAGLADISLLAIRDDALGSFLDENPSLQKKPVIHFSGATLVSDSQGFHPLMSFGPDLYDMGTYQRIPFVVETGTYSFLDIFPSLKNPHYTLEPQHKALYHSYCVMSGNFTTILWQEALRGLKGLGLPQEALLPYMNQIFSNLTRDPYTALTGPLARRDLKTIEKNLKALEGTPLRSIYSDFVRLVTGESHEHIGL